MKNLRPASSWFPTCDISDNFQRVAREVHQAISEGQIEAFELNFSHDNMLFCK